MDNQTVVYSGQGFPASNNVGHAVDWTNEIPGGLKQVRAKWVAWRGDFAIIQSNRSQSFFCVPKPDWLAQGGDIAPEVPSHA